MESSCGRDAFLVELELEANIHGMEREALLRIWFRLETSNLCVRYDALKLKRVHGTCYGSLR